MPVQDNTEPKKQTNKERLKEITDSIEKGIEGSAKPKGWFPGVCQGPLSPVPEGGASQREDVSEMFFHGNNTTPVKRRSCPRAKRRPALRYISQDSPEKQSQQER